MYACMNACMYVCHVCNVVECNVMLRYVCM